MDYTDISLSAGAHGLHLEFWQVFNDTCPPLSCGMNGPHWKSSTCSSLPHALLLATTDLFTSLPTPTPSSCLPKCHIVGITQWAVFPDGLLSPQTHLKFPHVLHSLWCDQGGQFRGCKTHSIFESQCDPLYQQAQRESSRDHVNPYIQSIWQNSVLIRDKNTGTDGERGALPLEKAPTGKTWG